MGDLARRGVQARGLPWNDESDQLAMLEAVRVRGPGGRPVGGRGRAWPLRPCCCCSPLPPAATAARLSLPPLQPAAPILAPSTPPASAQDGTLDALVLDSYVLQFSAASSCDLTTVGGVWQQAGFAAGSPLHIPGVLCPSSTPSLLPTDGPLPTLC